MTTTERMLSLMKRYGLSRGIVSKLIREHGGRSNDRMIFDWLATRKVPKYANACLVIGLYEAHHANTSEFLELVEMLSEDSDGKRVRPRVELAA